MDYATRVALHPGSRTLNRRGGDDTIQQLARKRQAEGRDNRTARKKRKTWEDAVKRAQGMDMFQQDEFGMTEEDHQAFDVQLNNSVNFNQMPSTPINQGTNSLLPNTQDIVPEVEDDDVDSDLYGA